MYMAELINGQGFVLLDEEFNNRKVWLDGVHNPPHIRCTTDTGIICLIPEHLWEKVEKEEQDGDKQET